jgi:hypothetical protein
MRSIWTRLVPRALALATIATAASFLLPSHAEVDADIRGGVNADAEGPFLGAGILSPLGQSRSWYFNPNAEYTAGDRADVLSVNADIHYDFETSSNWGVWMGGGPAFVTYDPELGEDDDNDVGLNFLVGVGAKRGDVRPFFQGKVLAADDSQLLIAGGVRW